MEDLTFGEQVKIILGRKGMTIKRLAELIELRTGKKMSRQNLTQRLGRDNFQEQDMRMIAKILDCPFHLSIMTEAQIQPRSTAALEQEAIARTEAVERAAEAASAAEAADAGEAAKAAEAAEAEETAAQEVREEAAPAEETRDERDMTIGELYEIHQELAELEENAKAGESVEEIKKELEKPKKERFHTGGIFLRRKNKDNDKLPEAADEKETRAEQAVEAVQNEKPYEDFEPVIRYKDVEEDREAGEINPYTGREYQSNSVRMHPTRIGYVQVYDRTIHKWTDMTEWAFLGLQERKKALLGSAYEPPIYLD
ncbi:MAG TPA: hypothetical protein H9750_04890 [Candidatus Mediterraneibacter excrementavium]|nr:hypothetical protein [Candidatus Mediterraneibacter excrementavium]